MREVNKKLINNIIISTMVIILTIAIAILYIKSSFITISLLVVSLCFLLLVTIILFIRIINLFISSYTFYAKNNSFNISYKENLYKEIKKTIIEIGYIEKEMDNEYEIWLNKTGVVKYIFLVKHNSEKYDLDSISEKIITHSNNKRSHMLVIYLDKEYIRKFSHHFAFSDKGFVHILVFDINKRKVYLSASIKDTVSLSGRHLIKRIGSNIIEFDK